MNAPSAKGLFRATGNQPKPVNVRLLDGSYAKAESLDREPNDFNPTPPEPTQSLLHYERDRLKDFPTIWEPACGDGRMVRDIQQGGFNCIGSDLFDRGCGAAIADFFAYQTPLAKAIITNPPYNLVNARDGQGRWIWHALDVLHIEYMALLLNWSWPGAGALGKLWSAHPPARVYLMRWKIDFTGQGAPPMLNGWFIWDRQSRGETVLRMMDRIDGRQATMLGDA